MDNDLIKSIAIGIAAGLSSAALLPMLFKGKLRFEREYVDQRTYYDKRLAEQSESYEDRIRVKNERHLEVVQLKDREIARLQDGLDDTQKELREQYVVVADLTKQVLSTIHFLQSLAGLAASERRGRRDANRSES